MNRTLPTILVCLALAASRADLAPESYYSRIAQIVADGLPQAHLSRQEFDDGIAVKALDNFLDSLDFDHSFFLESDVLRFRTEADLLDDEIRSGHLDFAYGVYDAYLDRASNRVAHVRRLLEHEFDFAADESIFTKRKDAPWPADEAAWDDLWRKKIKNELLSQIISERIDRATAAEKKATDTAEAAATNAPAAAAPARTPVETVRNRYDQFLAVLGGNDAEYVLQLYLNAFTQAYDTHSEYLSPRANEDFDIAMKLSLSGIGALLTYEDGAAKVVRLIPGGPAEKDGRLKPNDRITAVGQGDEEPVSILYWPLYKSVRLIRGEKGSRVALSVIPASDAGGGETRTIEMVRDEIKLEERAAKADVRACPGGTETAAACRLGIITLPDFYADQEGEKGGNAEAISSSRDVKRLLNQLIEEHVDGLLLDLRNNGGGSLPDAVEMTGFFIERGPVVQVKANRRVQQMDDPDPRLLYDGPLVVLVNRQSASASEILASALQDYGRAVIVGDSKTHGKGTVQTLFPVREDQSSYGKLKITTAGFYRIDGHTTQFKGVVPDIVIPSALDMMEIGEEFLANALSLTEISPARYKTWPDVRDQLDHLRSRSEERRSADARYLRYAEILRRLKERTTRETLSLKLEDRLALAHDDKELDKLVEEFIGDGGEEATDTGTAKDDDAKKKPDIILDESLHILRDLVESSPAPVHKPVVAESGT